MELLQELPYEKEPCHVSRISAEKVGYFNYFLVEAVANGRVVEWWKWGKPRTVKTSSTMIRQGAGNFLCKDRSVGFVFISIVTSNESARKI